MARPRRIVHIAGVLGAAALLATGCGGGDEVATGDTPTPDANSAANTVATPSPTTPTTVATNPDGTPLATDTGAGTGLGATATVPKLDGGDDVGGAFGGGTGGLFTAKAGAGGEAAEDSKAETETTLDSKPAETTAVETTKYAGAVIYVDGTTYKVNKGSSFPKGSPIFRLISISGTEIEVDLIAGEFTTGGGSGTFLDKGDLVTVVNSTEQVNYKIKFLRPIVDATGIGLS